MEMKKPILGIRRTIRVGLLLALAILVS